MNQVTTVVKSGKDRKKVKDECLKSVNDFGKEHEIIQVQFAEAQIIGSQAGVLQQQMQVIPEFEITAYVLYEDE